MRGALVGSGTLLAGVALLAGCMASPSSHSLRAASPSGPSAVGPGASQSAAVSDPPASVTPPATASAPPSSLPSTTAGASESSAPPLSPSSSPPLSRDAVRAVAAQVHADELGVVPVLMIHQVSPTAGGDYGQTPDELRAQLVWLAENKYVPITAAALASGHVDVPAGDSPVVLTFDDGDPGQFQLGADGEPTPDCAVGVLEQVAATHPGFTPVATLYVNQHPFGHADPARSLGWLVAHGFEIGNHTLTHPNLGTLVPAAAQRELASEQQIIEAAVPGYHVSTMALPYGAAPKPPSLALDGTSSGVTYHYIAAMLVGAGPAPSPYSTSWKPSQVPRLRSGHNHVRFDAEWWLPRIATTRYVSDGDPDLISFPAADAGHLAPGYRRQANPY